MYEQPIPQHLLYYMLYGGVTAMAMMASCYLLLRKGNAFDPDITPPAGLRRWTAAFLAVMALGHVWYLPTALATSSEDVRLYLYVGASLDFMIVFPLTIAVMLAILQDRRRPLWPAAVSTMPPVVGLVWCMASHSDALVPAIYAYLLVWSIALIICVVRALRQYRRWLRDNYADLEGKEVWQSLVVLTSLLFMLVFYMFGVGSHTYEYIVQMCDIALILFLLWRAETLRSLTPNPSPTGEESAGSAPDELYPPLSSRRKATGSCLASDQRSSGRDYGNGVGGEALLLQKYCIDTRLYLQHDLTLLQLAKALGTNRFYLSQYFSNQGMTYNAYINNLRIDYFITLYQEAVADGRSFTAQQLAYDSGYHSYSTFSLAFKQRTGQTVTAWMREAAQKQMQK